MAIKTYAVIKSGVVENVVTWDGVTSFSVSGATVVEATADTVIGSTYNGSSFTLPTISLNETEQAEATTRNSAITKLKALGLTDAEVAAIKENL